MPKPKHAGGRPTKYNAKMLQRAKDYVANDNLILHTIEGLALELGIWKETVYNFEKKYPEFLGVIKELRQKQEKKLTEGALIGKFNPTFSIFLAKCKFGWKEAEQQPQNQPINILVNVGGETLTTTPATIQVSSNASI